MGHYGSSGYSQLDDEVEVELQHLIDHCFSKCFKMGVLDSGVTVFSGHFCIDLALSTAFGDGLDMGI